MAEEEVGFWRWDSATNRLTRERLPPPPPVPTRRSSARTPPWHLKPAYTTTRRRRPGRRGPASLLDMAVKLVADNMAAVGVDALRRCPAVLVWRVWDYLDHRRRGVNFHAWKTILLALPDYGHPRTGVAPPQLLGYHQVLQNPQGPLQTYLDPLAASPFEFLTGVVISQGARFDESELLALARLRNLAFLAIVQPGQPYQTEFPRVTDRLIREWSLLPDPFPALRSLLITSQGETTARSLASVAQFPALETYAVGGRRADWDDDGPDADDCWRRQEWHVDIVAKAAAVVPLLPGPYAHLELGNGPPYRDRYEAQYAFHRVRPGDDPKTPLWRLGFHLNHRKRKARTKQEKAGEEEAKGGQDAEAQPRPYRPLRKEEKTNKKKKQAGAHPGPSQTPRAKRLKGLQDVFQSFGA